MISRSTDRLVVLFILWGLCPSLLFFSSTSFASAFVVVLKNNNHPSLLSRNCVDEWNWQNGKDSIIPQTKTMMTSSSSSSSCLSYHTVSTMISRRRQRQRQRQSLLLSSSVGDDNNNNNNNDDINDDHDNKFWGFQPLYAIMWTIFLGAIAFGPGEINSVSDMELIKSYVENPSNPEGFSRIFLVVFNYLGLMPILIAALALPQASRRGLPGLPFIALSFGLGYGAIGPYLTLRAPPKSQVDPSEEASWLTQYVLDSRALGLAMVVGIIGIPLSLGCFADLTTDFEGTWAAYQASCTSSKFVCVSSVDLTLLSIAAAALIPNDWKLRQPNTAPYIGNLIATATLMLPMLGPALYCTLRPGLSRGREESLPPSPSPPSSRQGFFS